MNIIPTQIIDLQSRYAGLEKDQIPIVFFKCDTNLIELFKNSCFLLSYILNKDTIVILKYDTHTFPTVHTFYNHIINLMDIDSINAFSYWFSDSNSEMETYHIIHNSTFAELIVFYDDIALDMGVDSIEFNINGISVTPLNFPIKEVDNVTCIYNYITSYIAEKELEIAFVQLGC